MTGIRPPAPFASVVPGPLVIAHRGGSFEAPENTVASVRHGVEVGADWQEIDVTLSKDDQVVVIHDDTLERTTNGTGHVENKTIAQLKSFIAGKPKWSTETRQRLGELGITVPSFGDRYASEHVPTLQDVLAVPNSRLMIELKKTSRPGRLAERVVQAVHATRASERVALGSFEFEILDAIHQIDPSLPLIAIVDNHGHINRMLDLPIRVLAVDKPLVDKALAAAPAGVAVWTWTVYAPEEASALVEAGAHGLITDAPSKLLSVLREPAIAGR